MPKHHHILPTASNLLGIALIIITGLHVSDVARHTFADEIAWAAALFFILACTFSYLGIRDEVHEERFEHFADLAFLAGLATLSASVLVLARTYR